MASGRCSAPVTRTGSRKRTGPPPESWPAPPPREPPERSPPVHRRAAETAPAGLQLLPQPPERLPRRHTDPQPHSQRPQIIQDIVQHSGAVPVTAQKVQIKRNGVQPQLLPQPPQLRKAGDVVVGGTRQADAPGPPEGLLLIPSAPVQRDLLRLPAEFLQQELQLLPLQCLQLYACTAMVRLWYLRRYCCGVVRKLFSSCR